MKKSLMILLVSIAFVYMSPAAAQTDTTSVQYPPEMDPIDSKLFFASTARPMRAGQVYFSLSELFVPGLAIGMTNFLSIAGGVTLFPLAPDQLFYLSPKLTVFESERVSIAANLFYSTILEGGKDRLIIAYGAGTYGDDTAAVTVGAGWGLAGIESDGSALLMLGGELRLSSWTKCIAETWIPVTSKIKYFSVGIRGYSTFFVADIGVVFVTGIADYKITPIPWLGITFNIGGR